MAASGAIDVAQEVERRDQHDHAEDALYAFHPGARLRQRHREGGDGEEEHAHAERVGDEQRAAEHDRLGRGHVRQDRRQHRAGARRGDDAADEAHGERAAEAAPADADERRCCSPDGSASSKAPNIDSAMTTKSPAIGTITHGFAMKVPNARPASAEADAERRVHDADAGHVQRRQRDGAPARHVVAARAEERHRDRDERIHARRQAGQEPSDEDASVGPQQPCAKSAPPFTSPPARSARPPAWLHRPARSRHVPRAPPRALSTTNDDGILGGSQAPTIFLLDVGDDGEVQVATVQEVGGLALVVVDVDGDDLDAARAQPRRHLVEQRQLLLTRLAPRGPEVDAARPCRAAKTA